MSKLASPRGPLIGLVVVVVFVMALLGWWIVHGIRVETGARAQAEVELRSSAALALELLNGRAEPVDPDEVLARLFPGLDYQPADGARGLRDTRTRPLVESEIVPDLTRIVAFDERTRGIVRMFLMEGMVFIVVQLIGVGIVYGALRREVRLKRQQENFVSAVTHELKSPLTSLDLFIQTIRHHDLPREKQREILEKMEKDTQRLTELVSNLLDAGRALTGRFRPEPERLDLGTCVGELVDRMRGALEASRARLEVETPAGTEVRADRRYLESILRNLVQNAVTYTSGDPVIHVSTRRNGSTGVIEVRDQGLGLERADQERIFEKFYRVGDEMVRRAPGSGLGLFLSREMARAMGGNITAESAGPGRGSTFRVSVPLAEA